MCPSVSFNLIALKCFLTPSRSCSIGSFLEDVKTDCSENLLLLSSGCYWWPLLERDITLTVGSDTFVSPALTLGFFLGFLFWVFGFFFLAALCSLQNKSLANQKPLPVFCPSSARAHAVLDTCLARPRVPAVSSALDWLSPANQVLPHPPSFTLCTWVVDNGGMK